jgi:hypothetical protein
MAAREWRAVWLLLAAYFYLATPFVGAFTGHHERMALDADGHVVICSAASMLSGKPADSAGRPAALLHCQSHDGLCSASGVAVADRPDPPVIVAATERLVSVAPGSPAEPTIGPRSSARQRPQSHAPPV